MMKRFAPIIVSLLMVLTSSVMAEVRLPALLGDGMVLQRESRANFWGWAEPGEKIDIESSWGAKATATADDAGKWQTELQTPAAGGPFTIKINNRVIQDVLSGEVWICSGQSNMDCNMNFFTKKAKEQQYQPIVNVIRQEVATASDNLLRQIQVPHKVSPLERQKDFKGSWVASKPATNPEFTATGYYFGRELRERLDVPVGLVKCAWGGTRVQPWIPETTYRADPEMEEYYEQEMSKAREMMDGKDNFNLGKIRQYPAVLFKGMIAPVIPYTIKGVIWYQGESNRRYMTDSYEKYFETMIESWRKEWKQGAFPFYWAQLAAFSDNKFPEGWVEICDQQRRALDLPNTGMAVLNDIGEAKDIHPRNKIDAGKRLALWALANDYGIDVPAFSGPLYKTHRIEGNHIIVEFEYAGSGLVTAQKELLKAPVETNEPLSGFEIKGEDGVWRKADASIIADDKVAITSPDVENPVAARYAWQDFPAGINLYNKEGLPASVFTTEE